MKHNQRFRTNLVAFLTIFFILPSVLLLTSCGGETKKETKTETVIVKKSNSELLLAEIVKNGDLINSSKVPTMVKSEAVNKAAEGSQSIIDLRSGKDFANGHIKGATNIKLGELIDYVKSVDIASFEKVVIVCYTGQTASYATSVLRMMGYNNVYAMKWGMCAWNKKFSDRWLKNATASLEGKLSTEPGKKGEKGSLPTFDCKKKSGLDILNARASKLLSDGFKNAAISIDDIIASPSDYYIVNYWGAKLYNLGHIQGAVQYKPKASLGTNTELLTLPTDKKIVVYCFTGQHSAFVTAYLRMLGYDAKSLKYGANSFMNTMMKTNKDIGHGFSEKMIHDFATQTSEYVAEGEVEEGGC